MQFTEYNHLDDGEIKALVSSSISLLKKKPQLIRTQIYDLSYEIDCCSGDINQKLLELSSSYIILDRERLRMEGDQYAAEPQSYQWKILYLLDENDDWRACKSEMDSITEVRNLLNSLKWELKNKRDVIMKLFEKEI